MIDIAVQEQAGLDLGAYDTQNFRAANLLSVQLGSLEYEPDFGIDLKYFLSEDFKIQNDSFKAYLVEALANRAINVASIIDEKGLLSSIYNFNLTPEEQSTGMIAR